MITSMVMVMRACFYALSITIVCAVIRGDDTAANEFVWGKLNSTLLTLDSPVMKVNTVSSASLHSPYKVIHAAFFLAQKTNVQICNALMVPEPDLDTYVGE